MYVDSDEEKSTRVVSTNQIHYEHIYWVIINAQENFLNIFKINPFFLKITNLYLKSKTPRLILNIRLTLIGFYFIIQNGCNGFHKNVDHSIALIVTYNMVQTASLKQVQ